MGLPNAGQFQKGAPSKRALPVGSTRIDNGHIKIRCADGVWRYRARVMWAAVHGPIPPNHLIHHINADPFDDRLENFQLVTRSEHMRAHRALDPIYSEHEFAPGHKRGGRRRKG